MARKDSFLTPLLVSQGSSVDKCLRGTQFSDTDPQMLYALWAMEMEGKDPDRSLDEISGAQVLYDKFRPRLSNRHRRLR